MNMKILIRTPNHLGDCVMALPMINEAREAHPGAEVTLLVPSNLADLFAKNPAVDQIIKLSHDHIHGLLAVVKIKELLSSYQFDLGYILPPSFGAAAGMKLGSVKERIGYITDGRRLLLTKPLALPVPMDETHRSELYFNLLRRGAGVELEYVKPKMFLDDDDMEAGNTLLQQFGIGSEDDYATIAFRAVAESRRWGVENYTALIKHLIKEHKLKCVLIGATADSHDGDIIAEATSTKEVVNLAGKTSLREAAAILSNSKFFIGNDSGPAHLAAAVGAPIIVISGADNPMATSPIASHKKVIIQDHFDCISCEKNICPLKGEEKMQCMKSLTVDRVANDIADLLQTVGL